MRPKTVLVVDDEEAISWSLRRAFDRAGYRTQVASSAEAAFALAARDRPDAVVLDVRLPGLDGLSALGRLRDLTADAPVVVMTAHGNLSTAVRAVEGGAFEYLPKPFDLAQALDAVARALASRQAIRPASEAGDEDAEAIVGRSPAMQAVFKRIALVAPHDASVLITGESGTGKELAARAIHRHSPRRDHPFMPVHVAALNPNLVESELFGHVRGAFTGAEKPKQGLLELADGGTVFLDELADIPAAVQAKLLRVLEHQEVLPVGGNVPVPIRVRILAATHQDLTKQVAARAFRHDLYFRLNVFEVRMPSLRDRLDDIPLLSEHFLRRFAPRPAALPAETVAYLQDRDWPGNVRELRNALEHAAIVARGGPLMPAHFPKQVSVAGAESPPDRLAAVVRDWVRERVRSAGKTEPAGLYDDLLRLVEQPLLEEVFRVTEQNRVTSARWLGIARATLRKLMTRYGVGAATDEAEDEQG